MIITKELIIELQKRVEATYEEAEKCLRRTGGNIDQAAYLLQRRKHSSFNRLSEEFEKLIRMTIEYHFILIRKTEIMLNLPIFVIIIFLLMINPKNWLIFGAVFIAIALLTECELRIQKKESVEPDYQNQRNQANAYGYGPTRKEANAQSAGSPNYEETFDNSDMKEKGNMSTQGDLVGNQSSKNDKENEKSIQTEVVLKKKDNDYYEITIDE